MRHLLRYFLAILILGISAKLKHKEYMRKVSRFLEEVSRQIQVMPRQDIYGLDVLTGERQWSFKLLSPPWAGVMATGGGCLGIELALTSKFS